MLTLFDRDARHNRRAFLRIGGSAALGAGGLTLSDLAALRARAETVPGVLTGKSVIFLFLHGGPSQFETFDPKMGMPVGIRSATGEIGTKLPGVTFGQSLPRLAALADRMNIVRSYVPGDANHDLKPLVGRDSSGANLGALYSRIAGANNPRTGLPANVVLFPRAVDSSARPVTTSFGRFNATGPFSAAHAPYDPSAGGELSLAIPRDRLDDRQALRTSMDGLARRLDQIQALEGVDGMWDQAYRLLTGGLAEAFDLSREDPRLVARYDTAPLVRPDAISKKWKNHQNYTDNARSLGKLLLLARRLCERGCGFVTVTTNFVWDMHADENNATMEEGMRYMGPPLDYALSAFIEDLRHRGLDEKILLVACGEMGRSPRINTKGGRDHWGNLGPLLLAGGGLPTGQVIGLSNRDGSSPQSEAVTAHHLIATIMHTLFDVAQLRLVPSLPREFSQTMIGWDPIPGLHA
ncbi:MAG: DUF1501 domain-containing protein [Paludisphaera borealis]|uniref:DUF1501 domain-containing protein n=1 Tax=Paludisphaera borealis TaxID=1387353 RepID=UPI00284F5654|nr:DUF1501 domain-containing protein [Paludisphaera borealis]MDR3623137.1 DUF1501 domain-containing protein [Paludisphaera borealis]